MEIKPNNIYLGDSYELIKNIPDKSIDLIYTDIPYQIQSGGGGTSEIAKRIQKINKVELKDISNGIDYSILDEFVRVMKRIYIYIVVRNKCCHLWNTLLKSIIATLNY